MNEPFGVGLVPHHFDFYYLWEQFHPVLGAIAIFVVGWIIALILAAAVKQLLSRFSLNHKVNQSTQAKSSLDVERILARIVFWFILIVAIVAGLNVLNLQAVGAPFSQMITQVLAFIPTLIAAAVVSLVAWLVATVVRTGLSRALAKTQLDEKLSQEVGLASLSQNLVEICYWLVWLVFLPMVLSILGLTGLLAPVQLMLSDAISYLPNLFIAAVILLAGYILAKIVRAIVEGLVASTGLQTQIEKLGLFKSTQLARVLGSLVFSLIVLTSLIIAFDALGVDAISQPATAMLNQVMLAIPNILAATIILILSYVIAKFVGKLLSEILLGTGIDALPAKVDLQRFLGGLQLSSLLGHLLVFFAMLFAVSEAANRLGFSQVNELIAVFIGFSAQILLGSVILMIGFWLASGVAQVIQRGNCASSRWLAGVVRVLVMGLVLAMGLRAMGIADSIVNLAFGLTLGGVAVAFALAFGLGGRQPAQRLLTKLMDQAEQAKAPAATKMPPQLPEAEQPGR
jgi:hypothetical protein